MLHLHKLWALLNKPLQLPKFQLASLDLSVIRKLITRKTLGASYCMSIAGSKDAVYRRADRYLSDREDMEFDVQALTHLYLNANPTLTERERQIVFDCHSRILQFYKTCQDERLDDLAAQSFKPEETEFFERPRID